MPVRAKAIRQNGGKMALNWSAIRKEYETGNTDLDALSRKHGCSAASISKRIKDEEWENILETGREKRLLILKAVQNSALKGIEKADDLLKDCGSLKDVEIHSKTVKAYKDVGLAKTEDVVGVQKNKPASVMDDFYDALESLSYEDAARVLEVDEE
jgi:hypothetical protein